MRLSQGKTLPRGACPHFVTARERLNQKIYTHIDAWRNRPIEGKHPYVFLDGIWPKRSWGGEMENVAVLVAIGVGSDGYREILGVCEGTKADKEGWRNFLRHLKQRGCGACG